MIRQLLLLIVLSVMSFGQAAWPRPAHWAQPLELDGVPNLYKVSDHLYRSAQPTAQGMANLSILGIRTVINLRTFHSDEELLRGTGLHYVSIPMQVWYPKQVDAIRFLKIVADTSKTPALVHCQHGADRTGAMVAVYRVVVQGWTKEEASREMTQGGYGHHRIWRQLPAWIKRMNVTALRRSVGWDTSEDGSR